MASTILEVDQKLETNIIHGKILEDNGLAATDHEFLPGAAENN